MSSPEERSTQQDVPDEELVEDLEAPDSAQSDIAGGLPIVPGAGGCSGYIDDDQGGGTLYDSKSS